MIRKRIPLRKEGDFVLLVNYTIKCNTLEK